MADTNSVWNGVLQKNSSAYNGNGDSFQQQAAAVSRATDQKNKALATSIKAIYTTKKVR